MRPNFDGTHQTFPDLDLKRLGIDDLYKSQKDAVWMLKTNGGGICDHEVGAGKTLIMCTAAYEMKRLGLANKPMIIGLKGKRLRYCRYVPQGLSQCQGALSGQERF